MAERSRHDARLRPPSLSPTAMPTPTLETRAADDRSAGDRDRARPPPSPERPRSADRRRYRRRATAGRSLPLAATRRSPPRLRLRWRSAGSLGAAATLELDARRLRPRAAAASAATDETRALKDDREPAHRRARQAQGQRRDHEPRARPPSSASSPSGSIAPRSRRPSPRPGSPRSPRASTGSSAARRRRRAASAAAMPTPAPTSPARSLRPRQPPARPPAAEGWTAARLLRRPCRGREPQRHAVRGRSGIEPAGTRAGRERQAPGRPGRGRDRQGHHHRVARNAAAATLHAVPLLTIPASAECWRAAHRRRPSRFCERQPDGSRAQSVSDSSGRPKEDGNASLVAARSPRSRCCCGFASGRSSWRNRAPPPAKPEMMENCPGLVAGSRRVPSRRPRCRSPRSPPTRCASPMSAIRPSCSKARAA